MATSRTIALIAHDGKKADMVAFAMDHRHQLANCRILATGHTGQMLAEKVGLQIISLLSGPMGGDAQIGAQVAEGHVAAVFFFIDPLTKHPHDPDIQMLMRVCNVHNVPLATNPATASAIIKALEI
jgi:methylglyoxal synthase